MRPFVASNAVTVALMSPEPGNGSRTRAEPAPTTLFGQAGLPPAWISSSSLALHAMAPFGSMALPDGNLMSNSRTAFGWLLFAVFDGSDESVENLTPTDLPVLGDV